MLFPSGRETAVERDDGGSDHLVSRAFDSLTDAQAVRAAAEAVVVRLNALGRAYDRSFRPVGLSKTFVGPDGGQHVVFMDHPAKLGPKARVFPLKVEGGAEATDEASIQTLYFGLSERDAEVAQALHDYGSGPLDNSRTWKVYEVIRKSVGDEPRLQSTFKVTDPTLKASKASVHDPAVSGDNARHGISSRPQPEQVMSQDEVEDFIPHLLNSWLDWKRRKDAGR